MSPIHTEKYSTYLRERAIIPAERKILISCLNNSKQVEDIHSPLNCQGYGRIRNFSFQRHRDWSANPLPILPAANALGLPLNTVLRAQVFQNAACNWRCWYCYVDFSLLNANYERAQFFTAENLINMYLQEEDYPLVLDLSGGQPDITPEWVLWIMQELEKRRLAGKIFLWSDDNLSNKYFWNYLDREQRAYIARFPNYARVGCFKGFDEVSFMFNTRTTADLFNQQFEIFNLLYEEGLDLYAYITFTSPPLQGLSDAMARFVDKLQAIHKNLPLRTVPLKIEEFTPMRQRVKDEHKAALLFQHEVHATWLKELEKRFSQEERHIPICEVQMGL